MDLTTGSFAYVPIPESKPNKPGLDTPYIGIEPSLTSHGFVLPDHLRDRRMHLDPDFEYLTYGDAGPKGRQIATALQQGDFLAFYSGMRDRGSGTLVYGLIGLLMVDSIRVARGLLPADWIRNAHTRRQLADDANDIVVLGKDAGSGRLTRCLVIGEYRDRAYRVTRRLLEAWGGVSAKDGFLQRSAVFPRLLNPEKFIEWWKLQKPELVHSNNPMKMVV
jgi:Nucleotide modification associated domain 3